MDYLNAQEGRREQRCRQSLQYLLLKVADGILISISEEIEDVVFYVVLLQMVHQVGTVALSLMKPERLKCQKV